MIISLESSLGVQFGRDYVAMVFLKKLLRKVVLDCHEVISVPEDMPEKERAAFLSSAIARAVNEKNINTESTWVGLPRTDTLLRLLSLPATAEENLAEVVRYEVGKYVSFPVEEIVYDYSLVERNTEDKTLKLLLAIARKETYERAFSILEKAGIRPLGMEVTTTALLNLAISTQNGNGHKPTMALVQVDRDVFETAWVHNGALRYSHMATFDKEDVSGRAAQIRREVRSGFRAAFAFQQWKGPGGIDSSAIYLTGGKDAGELLAEVKGGPDFTISPFPLTRIGSHVTLPDSSLSQTIVPVIGLALRGIQKVPYAINLLPQNLRKKTKKIGMYLSMFLFFVVMGLTVAWGFSSVVKKRLVLHNIEQEIDALKSEVSAIQAIQAEAQTTQEMMACIVRAGEEEVSHLDILKELTTIVPTSVWLTNMRYRKGSLQLSGYAQSASDLIAILDGSSLFHESEFTAPITRGREGESFKITTNVEKK